MSFSTEQGLDMLPHVIEIYDKSEFETIRADIQSQFSEGEENKAVVEALKHLTKNVPKFKDDLLHVVAIADDVSVDEARKQSLAKSIKTFKDIFQDQELLDLFRSAM